MRKKGIVCKAREASLEKSHILLLVQRCPLLYQQFIPKEAPVKRKGCGNRDGGDEYLKSIVRGVFYVTLDVIATSFV